MRPSPVLPLVVTLGLVVSCGLPCSAQLAGSPWPAFRHDTLHTGRSTLVAPMSPTLAWTRQVGTGTSSPAIGISVVYVLAGGNLIAMGLNGDQLWSYPCGTGNRSSPAISAAGVVHVASTDGWLYAINSDGTLKWRKNLSAASNSSPQIGPDGTVYVGSNGGKLFAFTSAGAPKFTYTAGGAISSSPALATDGTIYFGCDDGCLYALNANGTLKWKFTTNPLGAIQSSPAVGSDGTIHFGANNGYFFAVNPNGTQRWRTGAGVSTSSPALAPDGTIYFGCQDNSLYALSKLGALRWKYTTRGPVNSSPAVDANGVICFGSEDGSIYALNPGGTKLWEYAAGAAIGSSPAIGELQSVYVLVSNGSLLRLGSDTSPPTTPYVIDDGAYSTSATTLHASWTADDPESGIARYEYAIGTTAGGEELVPFTDIGPAAQVTRTDLVLANGARYYFSVRATNGAGLVSYVGVSDGILVDFTPPAVPVVIDDGKYTGSATTLHFVYGSGDTESGISFYEYSIGTAAGLTDVLGWQNAGVVREQTLTGLTLTHGATYFANIRAHNYAGLESEGSSNGILVDLTPPPAPGIEIISASASEVHFTITADDPESGISQGQYAILTSPDISTATWTDCSVGVEVTASGIGSGQVYVAARAKNGVDLWSSVSVVSSTIDTTPPTTPTVTDDGDYTCDPTSLHAVWTSQDPQSGVSSYSYCVGTSPGASDVVTWTSTTATSATATGLTLVTGARYYFSVKARNGVGLWSAVGSSDGIEYRIQASVWSKFRHDLANAGKSDVSACLSGRVEWRAQTEGYVESSAAFAGDGTIYIGSGDGRVYAVNPNGTVRWSYQTGGSVDSSPAIGDNGELYVGSCDHHLYCISPSGALNWRYSTGNMIWSSPAVGLDGTIHFGGQDGYIYALNANGTLKWRYNTGAAVWSSPAIAEDGTIYYACGNGKLYALTSAGAFKWSYTTGTAADSSPAIGNGGVIYFGSGDGYFHAINPNGTLRWRAYTGNLVDSSAAIGADGTVYVGTGGAATIGTMRAYAPEGVELWRVNLTGGVRSSPALDATGNIYFGAADGVVHALRPDGTTIWTAAAGDSVMGSPAIGPNGQVVVGSDDGAVYCFKDYPLDTTPPTTPVVTPAQAFLPRGAPLVCRWTASDPESGIESYSYCIGTSPGLSNVTNWTNAGTATICSRSDITVNVGQSLYVSVKARNHAGLESAAGVSTAVMVIADNEINLIGDAKKRPNGTRVYLPGKIVTAVYSDCVFVEEPDRTSGIRCDANSTDLSAGAVVDALGKITFRNGEPILTEASFSRLAAASMITPYAASMRAIAGFGATGGGSTGGAGPTGPGANLTGLMVRVSGRVTKTGAYYFVLWDGSEVYSPRGVKGIEIRAGAGDIPLPNAYATITGIVSREVVNATPTTILRATSTPELTILP